MNENENERVDHAEQARLALEVRQHVTTGHSASPVDVSMILLAEGQIHATLALAAETARLADAQERTAAAQEAVTAQARKELREAAARAVEAVVFDVDEPAAEVQERCAWEAYHAMTDLEMARDWAEAAAAANLRRARTERRGDDRHE